MLNLYMQMKILLQSMNMFQNHQICPVHPILSRFDCQSLFRLVPLLNKVRLFLEPQNVQVESAQLELEEKLLAKIADQHKKVPVCDLFDNEEERLRVFPEYDEIASPIQLRSAEVSDENFEADNLLEQAAQRDGGSPPIPASPVSSADSGVHWGSANKMPRRFAPPQPPSTRTGSR